MEGKGREAKRRAKGGEGRREAKGSEAKRSEGQGREGKVAKGSAKGSAKKLEAG